MLGKIHTYKYYFLLTPFFSVAKNSWWNYFFTLYYIEWESITVSVCNMNMREKSCFITRVIYLNCYCCRRRSFLFTLCLCCWAWVELSIEEYRYTTNINRPYGELTPQTCDSHVEDSFALLNFQIVFSLNNKSLNINFMKMSLKHTHTRFMIFKCVTIKYGYGQG